MTILTDSVAELLAHRREIVEEETVHAPSTAPASPEIRMSFFSKLKSALASMWKKAPAIGVAIASAINNLVPTVEKLDALVLGSELAGELNPILDKIKVGLSALKTTVKDAGGSSANVASIVTAIQSDLSSLLSAAQIKDPATAEKIKEATDVVAGAIADIHSNA